MDEQQIIKAAPTKLQNKTLQKTPQQYVAKATADNTRRAYKSAIRQFELHGGMLPASIDMIAEYITRRANDLNPRTLSLHITAISNWHTYQNLTDPTNSAYIRKLLIGVQREHGSPKRKAVPLSIDNIKIMIKHCKSLNTTKGLRDSALLQLGYFGAFRRSELVAIKFEDLQFSQQGIVIRMPKSKTDQFGQGINKAIPFGTPDCCPVSDLQSWLQIANIKTGDIFLAIDRWGTIKNTAINANSINSILKNIAKYCNLPEAANISSHSLRRGFATSAARAGADFNKIKQQGGWTADSTVRGYIEESEIFTDNAASKLY